MSSLPVIAESQFVWAAVQLMVGISTRQMQSLAAESWKGGAIVGWVLFWSQDSFSVNIGNSDRSINLAIRAMGFDVLHDGFVNFNIQGAFP